MKKRLMRSAAAVLCLSLCIPQVSGIRQKDHMIRVGLAYGDGALTYANLQNNTGYGSGYRFGYFEEDFYFEELGQTSENDTSITMLPTKTMYRTGSNYFTEPKHSADVIGCYHVVIDDDMLDFDAAVDLASGYDNAFPAWIDGSYQVRAGAYETEEDAWAACNTYNGVDVKGTSGYAVNVLATGTSDILFQFDGGKNLPFAVMPDVTGADDVRTWFRDYKYHGGFRYERINGGNLTVVNIVDMETYIKGVIPYEMSNDWPMEALKAQAVCARSYAYQNISAHKHGSSGFDVCNTDDCQVYHGVGTNSKRYQANERTDRAVDETAGMYGLYNGEPIHAFYSSSHGGASESIENVWGTKLSKYPYLCGVVDPYEKATAGINSNSYWKVTYTTEELTRRLQNRGYGVGTKVDSLDLTYSELGNVIQVKVNYSNGRSNSFTPKMDWGVRSLFGVSSLHFTINGEGASSGKPVKPNDTSGIPVNEKETLDTQRPVYIMNGNGKLNRVDPDSVYVISGNGKVEAVESASGQTKPNDQATPSGTVVSVSADTYVVEGSGNGHQLGMSQYGAYAMAEQGFTYDEIVEFYYPGVRVDTF